MREINVAISLHISKKPVGEIKLLQGQGSLAILQGSNITCAYAIKSELMHLFSLDFA